MSDIVEAWLWRDPGEIIERLQQRTARRRDGVAAPAIPRPARDRYYTQARRVHVKNIMRRRQ